MTTLIDFDKSNLVAVWFVAFGGGEGDWLMTVMDDGKGGFTTEARIRWYRDNKAFDSDDEKQFTSGVSKPGATRASIMRGCRDLAAGLARRSKGEMWECVRGKDETNEAFMKRFFALPFVHKKEAKDSK